MNSKITLAMLMCGIGAVAEALGLAESAIEMPLYAAHERPRLVTNDSHFRSPVGKAV